MLLKQQKMQEKTHIGCRQALPLIKTNMVWRAHIIKIALHQNINHLFFRTRFHCFKMK